MNLYIFTILKDFANSILLVFATSVTFHIGKHSTLVGPEVILGAEEEHGELSDLMFEVLDVCGDVLRVVDLCWPPSNQTNVKRNRSSFT